MQVKQIYKDVVTLVEGDNVFHLDAAEIEYGATRGLLVVAAGKALSDVERDLPLDQEWGV